MGFKKAGKSGPSGGRLKNSRSPNRKLQRGGRGKSVSVGRRGKSPFSTQGPFQQGGSGKQGYPLGRYTDQTCNDNNDCFPFACVPEPYGNQYGVCAEWIGDQEFIGVSSDGGMILAGYPTREPHEHFDKILGKTMGGGNGRSNGSGTQGGGCNGNSGWGSGCFLNGGCCQAECCGWVCGGNNCVANCSGCEWRNWGPECWCVCHDE
jgi:hypothetical protein